MRRVPSNVSATNRLLGTVKSYTSRRRSILGTDHNQIRPIFPKRTGRSYRQRKTCSSTNKDVATSCKDGPYQACYNQDFPEAPRCDVNSCKRLLRTAEGRLKIIQKFEKLRLHEKAKFTMGPYLRAKGLLNDASFRDTGPLEHTLPPTSVDSTITHASPNTPNRRNNESTPRHVLSRRPPSLDYQNYASVSNHETVGDDFPETNTQDVLAFTAPTNYKMNGWFRINPSDSFMTIMVLDTGAGPNCVAARYLPPGWQKKSSEKHEVTLQAANGKPYTLVDQSTCGFAWETTLPKTVFWSSINYLFQLSWGHVHSEQHFGH